METKKKKHGCLTAILIVIFLIAVGTIVGKINDASEKKNREKSYSTITWPSGELASQLPQPENLYGEIEYETASSLDILIAKESKEDYIKYVDTCMQNGFDVDYSKNTEYFRADNEEGYSLDVSYDAEYREMKISITAPVKNTATPEPEEEQTTLQEAENTPTPEPQTTPEPKEENSSEETASGIRPEFKESVDSYEEFMNEYVDFMKKYENSNGSDAQMLLDYSRFIAKYADMADKFNKLGDEDMTAEESTYYLQVQSRVLAKLSEVS